jgi:hypothetical protein
MWDLGYVVRPFVDAGPLGELTALCGRMLAEEHLAGELATYHQRVRDQETHIRTVARLTEAVNGTHLIETLFRPEEAFVQSLLGPDVVIQNAPHLRVGRPGEERDSIDLHRDSFYGSSIWHLNFWFPLIPLGPGSGLLLGAGTHRQPSRHVRDKSFPDAFRASVEKGSVENQLGFVYRRRTDDTIEGLQPDGLTLVAPQIGSYLLFFGCMVHGGINRSDRTRWTMDVRFSKMEDGSVVKPGYFRDFCRGVVRRVGAEFYADAPPS